MDDSQSTDPARPDRPGRDRRARASSRWTARVAVLAAAVLVVGCGSSDTAGSPDDSLGGDNAPATVPSPAATTPTDAGDTSVVTDPAATTTTTTTAAGAPTTEVQPAPDFAAIGPIVDAFVLDNELNGAGLVIVDRDDGIVHQEYWGEFDEDRISLIASASKMIVAGVLLALDDDGALDIDAPVADAVEWGAGNPTITPAQLLSNSSGLVGLGPNPAYGPYLCQFLPAGTLQECAETIFTTADDDPDVVAPDTEFRYGGAQWQVAGAVAEAASGRSWAELIEDVYVEPCGVESLAFTNHWTQFGTGFFYPAAFAADPGTLEPTDNPNLEGGAYITAPDYAALLLMHLRDGRCGDVQVLSPEALATMHADRTGATYGSQDAYGMGWWIDEANDRITDPGAYGAVPWLDLEDGYGAYLVIEADGTTGATLANQLYPIVEAAMTR